MELNSKTVNKHLCFILVLQVLIFINCCDSVMVIHKLKDVYNNVLSNSSKVWYRYIEKFLNRYLKGNILSNKNCRYLLFEIGTYSMSFTKFKKKFIKECYDSCAYLKNEKPKLISFLSGQFFL